MIKPLDKNDCLSVSGGFIVVIDDEISPILKYVAVYNDLTGDLVEKFTFNSASKQESKMAMFLAERTEARLYKNAEQNNMNLRSSIGFLG